MHSNGFVEQLHISFVTQLSAAVQFVGLSQVFIASCWEMLTGSRVLVPFINHEYENASWNSRFPKCGMDLRYKIPFGLDNISVQRGLCDHMLPFRNSAWIPDKWTRRADVLKRSADFSAIIRVRRSFFAWLLNLATMRIAFTRIWFWQYWKVGWL